MDNSVNEREGWGGYQKYILGDKVNLRKTIRNY